MGADEEEEKEGKNENAKKTLDVKPAADTLVLLRYEGESQAVFVSPLKTTLNETDG